MSLVQVQATPFTELVKQAEYLATSRIIPRAYQRQPADVVAAGLAGQAFGWDLMTSLRNYHVIEGTASMRPEAMLGLVRSSGHSVTIRLEDAPGKGRQAVATGRRADNGDEHTAVFSAADAATAGLANKNNWKTYQDAMLTWRAVSSLCRFLFPDVVLGAGYTPEEIGAETVDETGVPAVVDSLVSAGQAKRELLAACGDDKELAKDIWGDRGSAAVTHEELDALIWEAAEVLSLAQPPAETAPEPDLIPDGMTTLATAIETGLVAIGEPGLKRAKLGSKATTETKEESK